MRAPAEARSGTRQLAEPADRTGFAEHTAPAGHAGLAVHAGHQADRKLPAGTARTGPADRADSAHTDRIENSGRSEHLARTGHSANNYSG